MLDFLRKNIKKFAIFLWIAAIAFIVGGAYLFIRGPFSMGSNTAIEVGDIKISMPEFQKTYDSVYNFYVNMLSQLKGGNISDEDIKRLNIKQKTIDMLVERALLLNEAKKEGIKVTDKDVLKAIESNKYFWVNGHFSKEKYLAILKANNINPKDYEASLKIQLYINKLKSRLFKNVKVTQKEVKDFFEKNYSKVDLKYVVFNAEKYKKLVKVDDKKLKAFYDKFKEKYRVPTQIKFKYIVVPLSYVEKKVKVTDNDTLAFYNNHPDYFMVPLRIKVAHILIAKKDNESDSKLKAKAEKIYNMIISKKITFSEAAKKYSDDTYSKNVGGELGYVTKNMVVDKFWENIVKLKKGEISKPFKTRFGYHIAKVEYIQKPFKRAYKDVKKQIEEYIKQARAKKIWFVEADKIYVKARDSKKPLDVVAKEFGLEVKESPYMSLKNPKPPFSSKIIQNALLSNKGALLGPDLTFAGYIIYKVEDKKPSYIPFFDKIKDKVRKDFIKYEALKLAKKKAEEFISLKDNFDQLAKKANLKIHLVKNLTKLTPNDDFPCSYNQETVNEIFNNTKSYKGLCKAKDSFYVFEIADKKFDNKEFDKLKKSIKNQLLMEKEDKILRELISKLKKEVKIKINPKL
ncbi:peptidylprolyl isomerase [Hippea jasoniae]|uniref:peptidylprolyl isomerase n=1 Tax=Hippea jasoniae TaxID=944479 RepID=UPI00054D050F|nr:peptidylprolyl isomerase [Hippea jasoniae]